MTSENARAAQLASQGSPLLREKRVYERAKVDAVAANRLRLNLHDLPSGRPAAVGAGPGEPGNRGSALDLNGPAGPADRVDRVRREGDDRVQRPLGQFAMPEADRELTPIQVVLNRKNRRKSVDRQSHASDGRASEEFPALLLRDQVIAPTHT